MYKTVVYHREEVLGEAEIMYPEQYHQPLMVGQLKEIRIDHLSPSSDRCQPLAIVHTIASSGFCFKMESKQLEDSPLHFLHTTCVKESKTAVMPLGSEELHLVPMYSRDDNKPCFWGYNIAKGLYDASVAMLNLRCLAIVFDLDETLLVANTMRSFADKIEALQKKISSELDPQRAAGMLAEIKRYQDDEIILKQYAENDQVIENGRVIKAQPEIVPPLSDFCQPLVRPLIRLPERGIILTRINPQNRDTSVLVRLRPAWEDLRTYLTARGRKRFEVYVCTMAERDYALEMWRLLDPESNLINTTELFQRIVCVKSGLRKSLFSVFQERIFHPKMALVIDDRLKVWDDKDQPRVHVVPAFAPYFSPQTEENNSVPVLCLARNVACNVRGSFFRDFDECILPRLTAISYEDAIKDIPSPDVGNYLVSEDYAFTLTGNRDTLGVPHAEAERKEAYSTTSAVSAISTNVDQRLPSSLPYRIVPSSSSVPLPASQPTITSFPSNHFPPSGPLLRPAGPVLPPEPKLENSPAREEGEVPESELDPDTWRRLLILQHGQDARDHTSSESALSLLPPIEIEVPRLKSRGRWFPLEDEISPPRPNRIVTKELPLNSEPMHIEKNRIRSFFFPKVERSIPSDHLLHEIQSLAKEVVNNDDHLKFNRTASTHYSFPGPGLPLGRSPTLSKDLQSEERVLYKESPVQVFLDIAAKCGAKVEFRPGLVGSSKLQFSVEVWFSGEKIGEGIGRTRREAQNHAAECSLKNLAGFFLSRIKPDSGSITNGYAFLRSQQHLKRDSIPFQTTPESPIHADARLEGTKKPLFPVIALQELCQVKGLRVVFQGPTHVSNPELKDEVCAQVEIDGQILGKGTGLTWDDAKMRAAEKALISLGTTLCHSTAKRQGSPRSLQIMQLVKRLKPEFPGDAGRMPTSGRYRDALFPWTG